MNATGSITANTDVSFDTALEVVCAWPISGQYGLGSRILYYALVAVAVLGRRVEWMKNASLAGALLFPAVASIHAIALAGAHVDMAVDMDLYGTFQYISLGILIIYLFSNKATIPIQGVNIIILWTLLLLAGLLSLTVEFYRSQTSPCAQDGIRYPIFDVNNFPYEDNPSCGVACSVTAGPFSPLRHGSLENIYVVPAPDVLDFGMATSLAVLCCMPAILALVSLWNKIPDLKLTAVRPSMLNTLKTSTFSAYLQGAEVIIYSIFILIVLVAGERNLFSPQLKWQTEPFSSPGQWAPLVAIALSALASLIVFHLGGPGRIHILEGTSACTSDLSDTGAVDNDDESTLVSDDSISLSDKKRPFVGAYPEPHWVEISLDSSLLGWSLKLPYVMTSVTRPNHARDRGLQSIRTWGEIKRAGRKYDLSRVADRVGRSCTNMFFKAVALFDSVGTCMVKLLRPDPIQGHVRIGWTCRCGDPLDIDVPEGCEPAAHDFAFRAAANDTQPREANSRHPGPVESATPSPQQLRDSSTEVSLAISSTPPSASPSSGDDRYRSPAPRSPPPKGIKCFLLLCAQTSFGRIGMKNVDLTYVGHDEVLFRKVRAAYYELRGQRNYFRAPKTIQYIKFELLCRHQTQECVGNYEVDSIPSLKQVLRGEYSFHPCPPNLGEYPVHPHIFMHAFKRPGDHLGCLALERLPKKLHGKLRISNPCDYYDRPVGWGIYIVEGVNWELIRMILAILLSACLIFSVVWSVVVDVPGGTGIGQFSVGFIACALTTALLGRSGWEGLFS